MTIKGQCDNMSESVSWLNLVVTFCLLKIMSTLRGFLRNPVSPEYSTEKVRELS